MSNIKIIEERCSGCGKCISVCPFSAIRLKDKKAEILSNCNLCGACIEVCPQQAILMEEEKKEKDLSSYRGVWIFAEQREGKIMPVTYELLGVGRNLANSLGEELSALLLGENIKEQAHKLLYYDVDKVYLIESPLLKTYRTPFYTRAIVDLAREKKPEIILIGASSIGRDLAPRVATRLKTGLTAVRG